MRQWKTGSGGDGDEVSGAGEGRICEGSCSSGPGGMRGGCLVSVQCSGLFFFFPSLPLMDGDFAILEWRPSVRFFRKSLPVLYRAT
jgi:hypothetical protein